MGYGAGKQLFITEDDLAQLMHAAVGQTADAQNLALMYLHREIHQQAGTGGDVLDIQNDLVAEGAVPVVAVVLLAHLTTHHVLLNHIGVKLGTIQSGDIVAVTKHHHAVADLHQFLKVVGDEDDALVFVTHSAHDTINNVAATLGQSGGSFVNHQHVGIVDHDASQLYQLTILNVQLVDGPAGINIGAANGAAGDAGPFAETAFLTKEDVLSNGDTVDIALLLHDHADTLCGAFDHSGDLVKLSFIIDLAAGGRLHACQNRGNGRFAGAVLTDQTGDLAAVDFQVHMIERDRGTKVFAQLSGFNDQLVFIHGCATPFSLRCSDGTEHSVIYQFIYSKKTRASTHCKLCKIRLFLSCVLTVNSWYRYTEQKKGMRGEHCA